MRRPVIASLFLLLLVAFPQQRLARADMFAYVSLAGDKRIAVYRVDPQSGRLQLVSHRDVEGAPGALVVDRSRTFLFAAIRDRGRIAAFHIQPGSGELRFRGSVRADADPAYLFVERSNHFLLSAYYQAGKVCVHRITSDGFLQDPQWRTTAPRAHCIITDPSNQFACVPHTRPEAIYTFRFDPGTGTLSPAETPVTRTPPGTGPRHMLFHPTLSLAYCLNEQGSSVTVYGFESETGRLSPLQTLSTLPKDFQQTNACADLEFSPDSRFLYASNRGHDSLAVFAIDGESGRLTLQQRIATEKTPRQFNVTPDGTLVIAAGQNANRLTTYRRSTDDGTLEPLHVIETGRQPWWVLTTQFAQKPQRE